MPVSASAAGVITLGDAAGEASLAETQTIHDAILDSTCHFRNKDVSFIYLLQQLLMLY